jgi:hypothetical protein
LGAYEEDLLLKIVVIILEGHEDWFELEGDLINSAEGVIEIKVIGVDGVVGEDDDIVVKDLSLDYLNG